MGIHHITCILLFKDNLIFRGRLNLLKIINYGLMLLINFKERMMIRVSKCLIIWLKIQNHINKHFRFFLF